MFMGLTGAPLPDRPPGGCDGQIASDDAPSFTAQPSLPLMFFCSLGVSKGKDRELKGLPWTTGSHARIYPQNLWIKGDRLNLTTDRYLSSITILLTLCAILMGEQYDKLQTAG